MSFQIERTKRRKKSLKTLKFGLVMTVGIPVSYGFHPSIHSTTIIEHAPCHFKFSRSRNSRHRSNYYNNCRRLNTGLLHTTKHFDDDKNEIHSRLQKNLNIRHRARRIWSNPISSKHGSIRKNILKAIWQRQMVLKTPAELDEFDLKHIEIDQSQVNMPHTLQDFALESGSIEATATTPNALAKEVGIEVDLNFITSDLTSSDMIISLDNLTNNSQNNILKTEDNLLKSSSKKSDLDSTKTTSSHTVKSPGVLSITKFALPAIGVWLCGPLLSLIDTAIVGVFAGTNHQAALSPAVALTDYASLLLAFLYAATTNLVSASISTAKSNRLNEEETAMSTQSTLISSLQLSTFVGAALGCFMFCFTNIFLKALIGNDAIDPNVFQPASQYVKIRALGMPAAAILGSAQAACLGLKDIKSPLRVLGAAAGVNLMGDLIFVGSKYALFNGAAGAAWATIFSQYVAVLFFLKWLKMKPGNKNTTFNKIVTKNKSNIKTQDGINDKVWKVGLKSKDKGINSSFSTTVKKSFEKKQKKKSFSIKGYLHENSFKKRNIINFPSKKYASKFLPYVIPVTTTSVGRVSLFLAMAHVSSSLGTAGMAAQQIVLALFEALCPIVDSLSLTAQSFVPTALFAAGESSSQRDDNLRSMTMDFIKTGALFGATLVTFVCCIPLITRFFTADILVMKQVHAILPFLAGIFAMHGIVMSAEGKKWDIFFSSFALYKNSASF